MALTASVASHSLAAPRWVGEPLPQPQVQRRAASALVPRAQARADEPQKEAPALSRRHAALGVAAGLAAWGAASPSWALLEADEDDALLEKVKRERKERRTQLDQQRPDEGAIQGAVSSLRAVGKALDSGDLAGAAQAAQGVAASAADGGAVAAALATVNVEGSSLKALRAGISTLQAALSAGDAPSAKKAFVAAATALQELSINTGVAPVLKGL